MEVTISEEDKRRILSELARGDVNSINNNPLSIAKDENKFEANYQNFDDFAMRSSKVHEVTRAFFDKLKKRRLDEYDVAK